MKSVKSSFQADGATNRQTEKLCTLKWGLAYSFCVPFLNQLVRHDYLCEVNECFLAHGLFVPLRGKGKKGKK